MVSNYQFHQKTIILISKTLLLLPVACCLWLGNSYSLSASAQEKNLSVPLPSSEPLDINLLRPDTVIQSIAANVITFETISQRGVTIPSLWWAREQFAPGKLLNNWLAYPNKGRVDLVVNRQLWTLLDYMGRYRFVNNFGTVARDYGYNVRVFIPNQPETPLATYTCDFTSKLPVCNIQLQSSPEDSLRLRSTVNSK